MKNKERRFFGTMEVVFSFAVAHKTSRSARFGVDGKKMEALNKTHAYKAGSRDMADDGWSQIIYSI